MNAARAIRERQEGIDDMEDSHRDYLPGAGHDWGLPLYDPLVKLLGGDRARQQLLDQARLGPNQRVLDVGCGTGSLIVSIGRQHPEVTLVGIDPDPKALARAKRKTEDARLTVQLDRGFSDALPYPDASFDRVLSSFMFHHLPQSEKPGSLREIRRVLKPGGSLHLLDFAGPAFRGESRLMRWLHPRHHLDDNTGRRVLNLMEEAGFTNPQAASAGALLFLRTAYYEAKVPPTS